MAVVEVWKRSRIWGVGGFCLMATLGGLAGCGEQQSGSRVQISQGVVVGMENWSVPLAVMITSKDGTCSGTVVGSRAILTAGHCFSNRSNQGDTSDITVTWASGEVRGVSWYNTYIVNYDEDTTNDIALLELASPTPFGSQAWISDSDYAGGWASGFGLDENGNLGTLRQASFACRDANYKGLALCTSNWPSGDAFINSGDSGSAQIIWKPNIARQIVTAINTRSSFQAGGSYAIPVQNVRDKINYLNTGCRLQINGVPCH